MPDLLPEKTLRQGGIEFSPRINTSDTPTLNSKLPITSGAVYGNTILTTGCQVKQGKLVFCDNNESQPISIRYRTGEFSDQYEIKEMSFSHDSIYLRNEKITTGSCENEKETYFYFPGYTDSIDNCKSNEILITDKSMSDLVKLDETNNTYQIQDIVRKVNEIMSKFGAKEFGCA